MSIKITLSEDLSVNEIEKIYHDVILKQDFYGDEYGLEWNTTPFFEIAHLLKALFGPHLHLDVGCGEVHSG